MSFISSKLVMVLDWHFDYEPETFFNQQVLTMPAPFAQFQLDLSLNYLSYLNHNYCSIAIDKDGTRLPENALVSIQFIHDPSYDEAKKFLTEIKDVSAIKNGWQHKIGAVSCSEKNLVRLIIDFANNHQVTEPSRTAEVLPNSKGKSGKTAPPNWTGKPMGSSAPNSCCPRAASELWPSLGDLSLQQSASKSVAKPMSLAPARPTSQVLEGTDFNCDYRFLSSTMDILFHSKEFSDVKLVTEDLKVVPAHRKILSFSSDVFKAMFETQFEESESSRVSIHGVSYSTLRELVYYIYTGRYKFIDVTSVLYLMVLADQYNVQPVIDLAEKWFENRKIAKDNVMAKLIIADRLRSTKLKDICFKFLRDLKGEKFDQLPNYGDCTNVLLKEINQCLAGMRQKR